MFASLPNNQGKDLNATIELRDGAIIVHSRGGARGKPSLRNPDYGQAIRTILERLQRSGVRPVEVLLDSLPVQALPDEQRRLLDREEFSLPVDKILTLITKRGTGGVRRVKISVTGASISTLQQTLGAAANGDGKWLPASVLRQVEPAMIDEAIRACMAGEEHPFGVSDEYDVLLSSGQRLAPKAVFGLALRGIIGRAATPSDFKAGRGQPCFDIIEQAGYPIIRKDVPLSAALADEERTWAEGTQRRIEHLRRERAAGLSSAKKRHFLQQYGHIFCERCRVTARELGPLGECCIEVHHDAVALANMEGRTGTRLADLKCLCANCHRIVHREQM